MSINTDVKQLLTKQVTRKEFLQILGAAILATIGIRGLLNTLLQQSNTITKKPGYNAGVYGGKKQ